MSGDVLDLDALEKGLLDAVAKARKLEEIEAWLKMQPGVKSVDLATYLLKSNPPQREFIVKFQSEDEPAFEKIVNVFELGNERFRFNKLHG